MLRRIREVLRITFRVLTFSATREELDTLGWHTLIVALPIVWLVGYGRWWDDPNELAVLHRSGLGSVVYVFALSGLLWMMAQPLRSRPLSYQKMLAFVSLTALPAALYAIPVELFTSDETALFLNVAFLSVVSVYRVALLYWFLIRGVGMSLFVAAIATLTPISMIGFFLSVFGLLTGVLQIMGGLRKSGASEAFESVTGASCALIFGAPVLIIIWVVLGIIRRSSVDEAMLREENSKSDAEEEGE